MNCLTVKILAEPVLRDRVRDRSLIVVDQASPFDVSAKPLENAPRVLWLLLVILATRIILVLSGLNTMQAEYRTISSKVGD